MSYQLARKVLVLQSPLNVCQDQRGLDLRYGTNFVRLFEVAMGACLRPRRMT